MYNKEKFLQFIETDGLLKFVWEDKKKTVPADELELHLEPMFNGYVLEDSLMLETYKAFVPDAKYRMVPGYAYTSTKKYPREPETVMVTETEVKAAKFVDIMNMDGYAWCRFRVRRRFYLQLVTHCEKV